MNDVDTRHLRLVTALLESGSATAAADRLGVTQSAVSHQLRELESRLGCRVYARVGKRLVLTPAGHRLLRAAQSILPELERVADDIRRLRDGETGVLRLCSQCHTGYHWLPPLLQRFRAKHPGVELEIAVEHTTDPIDAVLRGSVDLALVTDRVDDDRLRVRALVTDEQVAIVAPGHKWASLKYVTPEQLAAETLLLFSRSSDDSFTMREILNPAGVRPARIRFVQLTEAIVEMVKANLGVTVLSRWTVQPALERGDVKAIRITQAGVRRQWSAVTLKSADEPAYLSQLLKLMPKAIR